MARMLKPIAIICLLGAIAHTQRANGATESLVLPPFRQQGCTLQNQYGVSHAAQQRCQRQAGRRTGAPGTAMSSTSNAVISAVVSAAGVNPLLSYDAGQVLPDWAALQTVQRYVAPAVQQLVGQNGEEAATLQAMEQFLNSTSAGNTTFNAVFAPLTQIRLRLDSVYFIYEHLMSVIDSNPLRNAADAVSSLRTDFDQRLKQSSPIYRSLVLLSKNVNWRKLKPEEQRLVATTMKSMQTSGVTLAAAGRAALNDIESSLVDLEDTFVNNLLDWTDSYNYTVTDKSMLDGLPPSVLAAASANAGGSATADNGPWVFRFDGQTADYVLSYASNATVRKAIFEATHNVAADGGAYDNTQLVQQILKLRQQKATALGYSSFGAYKFATMMATYDDANRMMTSLAAAAKLKAEAEDEAVNTFAQQQLNNSRVQLELWDWQYWRRQYKAATFGADESDIRQYLVVENVLNGYFQLAEGLFGISITNLTDSPSYSSWADGVQLYSVSDATAGAILGYFYIDLYVRDGKDGGGYTSPLIDDARFWRTASPAASNTTRKTVPKGVITATYNWLKFAPKQLPVVAMVLNQEPPSDATGGVALMWLDDLTYFLHEFGHAMQAILTTTDYGLASGWRNVEFDAFEVPAMMMEKWALDRDIFLGFATHYKTGKRLDEGTYNKIISMRQFGLGNFMIDQLISTIADLRLHNTYVPGGRMTPDDVYEQTYQEFMPKRQSSPPQGVPNKLEHWDHVFGGFDYESAYYSYIWSDVFSSNIFEKFMHDQPASYATNGQRFRDTYLALGGSKAPMQVFQLFMGAGTQPDITDLLTYYGLQ